MRTADDILDNPTQGPAKPLPTADDFLNEFEPKADISTVKLSPYEIAGGDPSKQTFEQYQAEHPNPSMIVAQRLMEVADTPEKKAYLAKFIQDKTAPELPVGSVVGDALTAAGRGPLAPLMDAAAEETQRRQAAEENRQKMVELTKGAELSPQWKAVAGGIPEAPSKAKAFVRGGTESLMGLADFLLSPIGVATAGVSAIPNEAFKAAPILKRIMSGGFAVQMASAFPGETMELISEVNKPAEKRDWGKIGNLLVGLTSSAAFTAMAGSHALEGKGEMLSKRVAEELNRPQENQIIRPNIPQVQPGQRDFTPPAGMVTADYILDQPAKTEPPKLVPALVLPSGEIVTGGDTHADVAKNYKGTDKAGIIDSFMADKNHVFVPVDESGKVVGPALDRKQAWKASGREGEGELHSQDLKPAEKPDPEAIAKAIGYKFNPTQQIGGVKLEGLTPEMIAELKKVSPPQWEFTSPNGLTFYMPEGSTLDQVQTRAKVKEQEEADAQAKIKQTSPPPEPSPIPAATLPPAEVATPPTIKAPVGNVASPEPIDIGNGYSLVPDQNDSAIKSFKIQQGDMPAGNLTLENENGRWQVQSIGVNTRGKGTGGNAIKALLNQVQEIYSSGNTSPDAVKMWKRLGATEVETPDGKRFKLTANPSPESKDTPPVPPAGDATAPTIKAPAAVESVKETWETHIENLTSPDRNVVGAALTELTNDDGTLFIPNIYNNPRISLGMSFKYEFEDLYKKGIRPGATVEYRGEKWALKRFSIDEAGTRIMAVLDNGAGNMRTVKVSELKPVESKTTGPKLDAEIVNLINAPSSALAKSGAMKRMAAERGLTTKAMQESVEAHVVRLAHAITADKTLSPRQQFDKIKELYANQPRFTARTSTSMADQAYSTPVPLSYALNYAIDSFGHGSYEPTAGNGALTIGDDLSQSHANEKNPARAAELTANGIGKVTQQDATIFSPGKRFPRVKTNPPFGGIDNQNIGGYGIKRIEHLISIEALNSMADDGKGYMILGAGLHSSDTGRGAQRVFENFLYSHYNVVGNFEVAGDLYSNQGAKFPVRVIVVDGRRKAPLPMGEYSPKSVERFTTWEDVWKESERIRNEIEQRRNSLGASGKAGIPDTSGKGTVPAENGGGATGGKREPTAPAGGGSESGGASGRKPKGATESSGGGTDKPTAGGLPKPENVERPTESAGGDKLPAGGLESGAGGSGDVAGDAGKGRNERTGERNTGIVSKPDSLIEQELAGADIDSILDEVEAEMKPKGEDQPDLLEVDKSKPVEAQIIQLRRMLETAERLDKPATAKQIIRRITELQAKQLGRGMPERPLMDRITEGYQKLMPGMNASKTAKYLYDAITRGEFNDMLRPSNDNTRKLFTELTGVKLPPSERETRKLFTGKPFDVLPENAEPNNLSPYDKAILQGGVPIKVGELGTVKLLEGKDESGRNKYLAFDADGNPLFGGKGFSSATEVQDALKPEIEGPKPPRAPRPPRTPKEPKPPKAPPAPPEPPKDTFATDLIRKAAAEGVSGVENAMKGLSELFGGGKRLGTGPSFDAETYARAKPHFEEAWKQFKSAGKTLKEYIRFIYKNVEEARPFIKKFLEEKQVEPKVDDPKAPPTVKATEHQVPYEARSKAQPFGTLIPKSIATGVHSFLDTLKTRVGPIDEWVSKELDMPIDQLRKVMAAEQIDGVAMAIDKIKNGGALIIGDQTGIGKGRQAAAIIRYALKNGVIPVFFTKDPKLFTDMYGDMTDIYGLDSARQLMTTVKPFILGNVGKATIVDTEGNIIHKAPGKKLQDETINRILNDGMDASGHNAIFATYSQINMRNARQKFLERLSNDNPVMLIMDEAHEAAGDGETSMQAAFFTGGTVRRGSGADLVQITVPGILKSSGTQPERGGGVLYLSATFAKRPENMPVYFRTSLRKAADSFQQIVNAMQRGGVALQQAVSEALAQAGEYIRREREFTGVSYDMVNVSVKNEAELVDHVDQVTDVLQQIVKFSKKVKDYVDTSTAQSGNQIDVTDFASIVHNQIGQLLLAAKADAVVEKAIESHKKGEKPVIALMNTMESFLDQFVEEKGIKAGQSMQLRWNELLKYALSRTLRTSEELPNGDTEIRTMDPAELGPELESAYNSILEIAGGIESKFPVSPIDYIIQRLEKAGITVGMRGFKMAELTGRTSGVEYSDFGEGLGSYKRFKKANKNTIVNGFNNGTFDGMLLNASGSTGLSAHASEKFKDQKPRHMIIAQPAADINVFVQTLGRIFRTGLVMKGIDEKGQPYGAKYSHMVLPLQAEMRPAAMAARKMKSLNANTTAEADNAIKIESEDFMNRYGDAIITDWLDNNEHLQDELDLSIEHNEDGTPKVEPDIARKFTGRMQRLPDADQKSAYEEIIPAYRQLIEQLKANGEYDLEIVTHDNWDGVRTSDEQLAPGTDDSNIFTSSVRMQTWDVSDKRKVPSGEEMAADFKKNLGSSQATMDKFNKFSNEAIDSRRARMEKYQAIIEDPKAPATEKATAQANYNANKTVLERWENQTMPAIHNILTHGVGKLFTLANNETGESWDATLTDVRFPKGNRTAASAFQFKFMVDAPGGITYLTGSMFGPDKWTVDTTQTRIGDLKGGTREKRYSRFIINGNPIKAYTATGGRGKMVRFVSRDGKIITGLLMPRNWTPKNLANDPRLDLMNGTAVAHYLKNHTNQYNNAVPVNSGGSVSIFRTRGEDRTYTIRTGSARRAGGSIFLDPKLTAITGDFTKIGNRMQVDIDERDLVKAADAIREITKSPFRPEGGKPEVLMPKVNESNTKAKTGGKEPLGPGLGAAIPGEFEGSGASPTATKNATVERERAQRGLPPAIEPAKRSFGRVWDEAMAEIDKNPDVQKDLISELRDHPRAVTDFENALLLHRQIDLQNDYGKLTRDLAHAYDDSKQFPNRLDDVAELKTRVAGVSDALFDLYEINKKVGTETGRGLNARKMMANEDFSLAQMELDKRSVNGGRPLTDAEHEQVRQLHQKIQKLRKDYDEYVAQAEQKISDLEAKRALEEIQAKAEPPIEPHIRKLSEKIVSTFSDLGMSARERIKARRREGRLNAGLDPADLADHAIVGAEFIVKGVDQFAGWSAKMVKEFGDYVKPHLKQIFDAANAKINAQISQQDAPKVKRARAQKPIETRKDAATDKIRDRIESGRRDEVTGYVRKLARLLVEEGISDRDELIDAVHSELMDIDPSFTRRETMDAISGYGDFKQLTKDQVSKELRDLKGQMQQVAKLEDMQAGQPPLKTGIERRTPSKEEVRLIKLVNEAKRKFQIPITDPNTQLKSALDTLKARMQSRTAELQQKIDDEDFAPRAPREPLKMDAEALRIKAEYERAKLQFERELQADRLKNRNNLEKATDTLVKWRRGFLLSSPITLAKLTSAAVQRMTFTPIEEAIGGALSSAMPSVARRARREGGFNSKAEASALTEAFTAGMRDAYEMLTTGASELDVLYGGGREGYVRESMNLPRSVIDFFGHLHGALKAPTKRAEFARSFEKRQAAAIADGLDVTDPMLQTRIAVESYKDANRSIFLNDNRIVTAYKMALRGLEQKNKETGKPPIGGKALATAARVVLPIVRVPANIVAETFTYAFGSISGGIRLANAFSKGIENLKPEEADLIMRELKKGSLGAAVMLLGFFNPQNIGGYYQQGEKRDPKDTKLGNIKLYGVEIPSFLLHNPLLETLQLGATVRRVADSKLRKSDKETRGVGAGLMAGALGLTMEVPFAREMFGELPKMFNDREQGAFWCELGKSLIVPQVAQFAANAMDKDEKGNTIKRNPQTIMQHIESGIPGLRENVPTKARSALNE